MSGQARLPEVVDRSSPSEPLGHVSVAYPAVHGPEVAETLPAVIEAEADFEIDPLFPVGSAPLPGSSVIKMHTSSRYHISPDSCTPFGRRCWAPQADAKVEARLAYRNDKMAVSIWNR